MSWKGIVAWTRWLVLALLIAMRFLTTGLEAQIGTASLKGLVTDTSGAVIPNATVTLESTLQRFTRDTVTDSAGEYVIPAIPPSNYKLLVKASGFKPEEKAASCYRLGRQARSMSCFK